MMASFRSICYCRAPDQSGFTREIDPSAWKDMFAKTFVNLKDYAVGTFSVGKGGVAGVVVLDDGCVKIRYRNDGEKNLRPAVSVYLLNRYGSVLSRIDDVWKIKRLKPGADAVSVPFEGNKDARYIDIEVAE